MHIKIKYIKQFLLISACVFFAGFNYLTYVNAADTENTTGSCDKTIDSDCDGLTNAEEKLYATNANDADTDGDGYSDGVEVQSGYDPTKPAPGDRIASINNNIVGSGTLARASEQTSGTSSLTEEYIQEFQQFMESKEGQAVTTADIQEFSETKLADKTSVVTLDSLPEIDKTQIKVLSQSYSNLSEADKKQKIQEDSLQYLYEVAYLLVNNAPTPIANKDDFAAFQKDFENRMADLADESNLAYFSDLGDRLNLFSEQLNTLEVPETMLDLHVKFARIIKGFLILRDLPESGANDPMGKIVTLTKAQSLTNLFADFLTNDLANYFKQISTT